MACDVGALLVTVMNMGADLLPGGDASVLQHWPQGV